MNYEEMSYFDTGREGHRLLAIGQSYPQIANHFGISLDALIHSMEREAVRDIAWTDTKKVQVEDILRKNAGAFIDLREAKYKMDTLCATDFIVETKRGDIAVRIRRYESTSRPGNKYRDFTIRAWRISGARTELVKIKDGFAKWYLYCWADRRGKLSEWMIIDVDIIRDSGLLNSKRQVTINPDGETGFIAISISKLDNANAIVTSQGRILKKGNCYIELNVDAKTTQPNLFTL